MHERTIITIGRQYGSGGHEIGKKLSEKLGIPCDILIGDMDSGGGDGAKENRRPAHRQSGMRGAYLTCGAEAGHLALTSMNRGSSLEYISFWLLYRENFPLSR